MFQHFVLAMFVSAACSSAQQQPVLLELFTSEGCSSCPPADALLEKLDRTQPLPGVQVIALSEHVDYWNHIGWKDPFSNAAYSRRQEQYAQTFRLDSVYTPQAVVDGRSETVGNDDRSVRQAILNASKDQKLGVRIRISATSVQVDSDILTNDAIVMLASADASTAVSKPTRGENSGRQLRHVAVVRSLKQIGVAAKGQAFAATIPIPEGTGNRRWIAFVQEKPQGRVLGVAMEAK